MLDGKSLLHIKSMVKHVGTQLANFPISRQMRGQIPRRQRPSHSFPRLY